MYFNFAVGVLIGVFFFGHCCFCQNNNNENYVVSTKEISISDYQLSIHINISLITNSLEMYLSGPSDIWFGIGFNSLVMNNTYAIVCSEDNDNRLVVHEYKLGHYNMGHVLSPSMIQLLFASKSTGCMNSGNNNTNQRCIKIKRDITGLTSDYYTFPLKTEQIDITYAVGINSIFDRNTFMQAYGTSMLQFDNNDNNNNNTMDNPPVMNTNTNIMDDNNNNNGNNHGCLNSNKSEIGGSMMDIGHGLHVAFTIYCKTNIIELSLNNYDYQKNWFGIALNHQMIGSKALVFTVGKQSENIRDLGLYSYDLDDKKLSAVIYHPNENWNKMLQVINEENNSIHLIYQQYLNQTNIYNLNTNEIVFRYAIGYDLVLNFHQYFSEIFTINLINNTFNKTKEDNTLQIIHGCVMFLAFGIFASVGIMSSKFRYLLTFIKHTNNNNNNGKKKPLWFLIHRICQSIVVILSLIGLIIAICFTEQRNNSHFSNNHMIIGLSIVCVVVFQPINALLRPHRTKSYQNKNVDNDNDNDNDDENNKFNDNDNDNDNDDDNDNKHHKKTNNNKSVARLIWEFIHKFLGYSAWILAQYNIYLGIKFLNNTFMPYLQIGWICILVIILIAFCLITVYLKHKKNYTVLETV